jgi:hypothetical protein
MVTAIVNSRAFANASWQAAEGRDLIPQYRIEFLRDGSTEAAYYLGSNSYPPRFPCYSFCSGWWLGSEAPGEVFNQALYLGLPDSVYLPLLRDLDIP